MDREIASLRQALMACKRAVVFTGAGISTESGIPDFRGPNGLWKRVRNIDFNEFISSEDKRRERWQRQFSGEPMSNAEPNSGHKAVARLVQMGKVSHVITQNVDSLHLKSGIPEARIIELHGNSSYATCLDCGKRFELGPIREAFLKDGTIPYCDDCDGIVKTATISFGQPMPAAEMQRAEAAVSECDLLMVLGSSLVVYPAAGFPLKAKQNGATLVIINNEETDLDALCDIVLHRPIGETLSAAVD